MNLPHKPSFLLVSFTKVKVCHCSCNIFRAMALNALESFVINTRDKLEQEFYIEASTEEEREKIREKLTEVPVTWLIIK